jgi:hypothetical protein
LISVDRCAETIWLWNAVAGRPPNRKISALGLAAHHAFWNGQHAGFASIPGNQGWSQLLR